MVPPAPSHAGDVDGLQLGVGRRGEVGEQRHRLVGVVPHRLVEGGFVELAHLGRHLLEVRLASELAPR